MERKRKVRNIYTFDQIKFQDRIVLFLFSTKGIIGPRRTQNTNEKAKNFETPIGIS